MPGARLKSLPVPLQRSREWLGSVIAGAAILIVVLALVPLLRTPSLVSQVTLVNPTVYQVNVEATGSANDGWDDLGGVPREGEVVVEGVVNEGGRWTFRFTAGGVYAAEMTLSRADLEHDNWRVNIPVGIAVPLQDAGLSPSAS
jgi:hypothetical protein